MEALAGLSAVSSEVVPGSLGVHEEYPERIAEAIIRFVDRSQ
jgi:hypothetical protein